MVEGGVEEYEKRDDSDSDVTLCAIQLNRVFYINLVVPVVPQKIINK